MAFVADNSIVWVNGEYKTLQEASVSLLTHTLHYGMGAFEGTRAYLTAKGTAAFRLQDHTKRLFNSAKMLGMQIPYSEDELNQVQLEIIRKNNLQAAYLRPLVYYGAEGLSLDVRKNKVNVAVATWEWGAYLGEENLTKGIKIKTSSYIKYHPQSAYIKAKACGHYINSILALNEATAQGYDEALLFDVHGYVAEGSGENLFLVKNNKIYTPTLTSCLAGITRDSLIVLARHLGYEVIECNLTKDDLITADELFFTGTAAEVTPIVQVDTVKIADGNVGKVSKQLQAAFFALVKGEMSEFSEWLSFV